MQIPQVCSVLASVVLTAITVQGAPFSAPQDVAQDAYLKSSSTAGGDYFGKSVAVDGDTVVVGADEASGGAFGAGEVHVFVRAAGVWSEQAVLLQGFGDQNDGFGRSVAVSGNTIVVGAPGERGGVAGINGDETDDSLLGAGAAYVFVRSGGTWSQQAYLKASNPGSFGGFVGDAFGASVAIDGDTVCVGAPVEASNAIGVGGSESDNSMIGAGAVYVFHRAGTTWTQQGYLKAQNTFGGDEFGGSVDISGDRIVVGAARQGSGASGIGTNLLDKTAPQAGAVYTFLRTGIAWASEAYIKATNTEAANYFGHAVAIDGSTLLVGAPEEGSTSKGIDGSQTQAGYGAGAVYVLKHDGAVWGHEAYLKPFYADPGISHDFLRFGASVAIHGNAAVVGAPRTNRMFVGVNGTLASQEASILEQFTGLAFTYDRQGLQWTTGATLASLYPKSDASFAFFPGDQFGLSVAVSNDLAVVGVPGEDSGATGIDGSYENSTVSESGSAYAYDLAATCGVFRYGAFGGANLFDIYAKSKPVAGSSFDLEVTFGETAPPGTGVLLISLAPANAAFAGGNLLADPAQSIFGPGELLFVPISALGSTAIHFTIPPGLAGLSFYAQFAVPTVLTPSGLGLTNGLRVTICP